MRGFFGGWVTLGRLPFERVCGSAGRFIFGAVEPGETKTRATKSIATIPNARSITLWSGDFSAMPVT